MTMLNATLSSGLAQFESHLSWTPYFTLAAVSSLLVGLLGTLYAYFFSSGNDANKIHALRGSSVVNAWMFFNKRYDFLSSSFNKTGHDLFSFKVLHHQVVAMSGDEARKIFFNEKKLNFLEGYRLLMGGGPRFEDIKAEEDDTEITFKQYLLKILHRDRLQDVIPTLFSDISRRMENWGAGGTIDPFKDIYDLVFQMTVRMASCQELANDSAMVQKMGDLYWKLEQNTTLVSLLLPWFPSTARKTTTQASKGLSDMVSHYVEVRRKANVPNLDAIDVLIADGADTPSIVHFVLGTIFAGVINTGMISCWILLYLGFNDVCKQKTIAEVQNLIAEYTNTSSSEPIHQRLSTIPISAWEDEMPVIECVIRETLRILGSGTPLRRNLADDLQVAGKTIDKGAFMVYNSTDVHLNERFYPEPLKFDPDRFNLTGEDDTQGKAPFLAWGTGRHPCAGMKVAKLEIKMILAIFLYRYEYTLVDQSGKPAKQLPQLDRNAIQKKKPMGEPCYLMYRKVAE